MAHGKQKSYVIVIARTGHGHVAALPFLSECMWVEGDDVRRGLYPFVRCSPISSRSRVLLRRPHFARDAERG